MHRKFTFSPLCLNFIFSATVTGYYAAAAIEEDDKFEGSWDQDALFKKIKHSGKLHKINPFESPLPQSLYGFFLLDYFRFLTGYSLSPPAYNLLKSDLYQPSSKTKKCVNCNESCDKDFFPFHVNYFLCSKSMVSNKASAFCKMNSLPVQENSLFILNSSLQNIKIGVSRTTFNTLIVTCFASFPPHLDLKDFTVKLEISLILPPNNSRSLPRQSVEIFGSTLPIRALNAKQFIMKVQNPLKSICRVDASLSAPV